MNLLGFVVCGGFGVKVDSTTFGLNFQIGRFCLIRESSFPVCAVGSFFICFAAAAQHSAQWFRPCGEDWHRGMGGVMFSCILR